MKHYRPVLKQIILAAVIDGEGRPVCTEMAAGNTPGSTVLLLVVDRLRFRTVTGRVCMVADRGMIAAETVAAFEGRGLERICGTFDTRPIFCSCDVTIRSHVFCSFLTLIHAKELQGRYARAGFQPEWRLVRDLDRLQSGVIEKDNKRITVRTAVMGDVGPVFRAADVDLPPDVAESPAT